MLLSYYHQRTEIFLTACSFLLLPTSANDDALSEAPKLIELVSNSEKQPPIISLLAPTFHICHSSCDSWYHDAQTKLQKYSTVLRINSKYLGYAHTVFQDHFFGEAPTNLHGSFVHEQLYSFTQHVLSCM